ncbi:MAG: hypothetical protein KTR30_17310 [Saprospiraceae bacterium]|nr:hypothetical protein [Saprospiraceae bacterium]
MKRPVVHFEIGCDDLSGTLNFYQEVFKWKGIAEGISAKIDAEGHGISGHITALGHDPHKYITFYIETDALQEDLEQLQAAGGEKILGPFPVGDGREFAWFKDPAGNMVGLITPLKPSVNPVSLVRDWFDKWETGNYQNLPITEDFEHTSPFGTISGRANYVQIVKDNEEKFLGHTFEIIDEIYSDGKACIFYRAIKNDHQLEVSEWHYFKGGLIHQIIAHYHIGEIRDDRRLKI